MKPITSLPNILCWELLKWNKFESTESLNLLLISPSLSIKNVGCLWSTHAKWAKINRATPGVKLAHWVLDFQRKTAEITRLLEAETSYESYELLLQTDGWGGAKGRKTGTSELKQDNMGDLLCVSAVRTGGCSCCSERRGSQHISGLQHTEAASTAEVFNITQW